jgi:hypothetical protein
VPRAVRNSLLLVLLVFMAGLPPLTAAGASFASLEITARGDEEFDFSTGVTTLRSGGVISDKQSGISIDAEFIRYRVDTFIEAEGAVVHGSFGVIDAELVEIDIPAALLSAGGGLQLAGRGFSVSAERLIYHARSGVVDLTGQVAGSNPAFSARRVLHDTAGGAVLLLGPYRFDDGFLALAADGSDATLELLPAAEPAEDGTVNYSASSTPAAETLELFKPFLP